MKKFLFIPLIALSTMLCFTSCGDDKDDTTVTPAPTEKTENIKVSSQSIAEGTEVDAEEVKQITITYAASIKLSSTARITLNGNAITDAKADGRVLTIPVSLETNKNYTLVVTSGSVISAINENNTAPTVTINFKTAKSASENIPDNDAVAVTRMLGYGWNLGNHFDSDDESNAANNYRITWSTTCPYWDGATPKESLYKNLAAAGVKTVRIPVTWGPYEDMTDGNYTIDSKYMATIKQNVLWAKAAGLNVVLNTHHDEYWMKALNASTNSTTNDELKTRIVATWKQIATEFKNEGSYLILESFNELNNNWQTPTAGELTIQNEWNQLVVNTIREVGGENATRWIAVPAYQASPTYALDSRFVIPSDPANKVIVAVHCYDPYNFTLAKEKESESNSDLKVKVWGHNAGTSSDEKNITTVLNKLKAKFIDNNIPCYIGEIGCSRHKTELGQKCRKYYLEYFCRAAYFAGLSCTLWDNYAKGAGAECHAYIDHNDGSWLYDSEELVKMMVKANTSTDATYSLESIYANAPSK